MSEIQFLIRRRPMRGDSSWGTRHILWRVSATAWQSASGIRRRRWRLWLAYPNISLRSLRCVRCVGWKRCFSAQDLWS